MVLSSPGIGSSTLNLLLQDEDSCFLQAPKSPLAAGHTISHVTVSQICTQGHPLPPSYRSDDGEGVVESDSCPGDELGALSWHLRGGGCYRRRLIRYEGPMWIGGSESRRGLKSGAGTLRVLAAYWAMTQWG